jgi:hypothetical protein
MLKRSNPGRVCRLPEALNPDHQDPSVLVLQRALPLFLSGEDPDFVDCICRLAEQERSRPQSTTV